MRETLRRHVGRALESRTYNGLDRGVYLSEDELDTAITAAIEALAAEAEAHTLFHPTIQPSHMSMGKAYVTTEAVADWLRSHLDAGRDGEAGR